MQRRAGNQATAALVSRSEPNAPAAAVGTASSASSDPEHLNSEELAGDEFDAAYHNRPPLRFADRRTRAVSTLQTLLSDRFGMREMMPRTFRSGRADGKWGPETTKAVRSFQATHDVRPVDGKAGHKTLLAMDRALQGSRPAPSTRIPVIELRPPAGVEAGPLHKRGRDPYTITVVGQGFPGITPLLISFESETEWHAIADENGAFSRTINVARRVRGS